MKRYMWLLALLTGCFLAVGEEISEDEKEDLEDKIKIGSVRDDTIEDDDDVKYEQLKFYTYQDENSVEDYTFRIMVMIELTEKKSKKVYYTYLNGMQGDVDTEYTGEDNWEFAVPHKDLVKPKVTAYIIQYGIVLDKRFIVIKEEMDDVESIEELKGRGTLLEQKARIFHQYSFRDSDDEIQQSSWKQL